MILLSDSSILPEELANQSVRLKEEQLRREEEKVRDIPPICFSRLIDCSPRSSARSNSRCNARSTKRGKNCWQKKSLSGERRHDIADFPAIANCSNYLTSFFIGIWRVDLLLKGPSPSSGTNTVESAAHYAGIIIPTLVFSRFYSPLS